jgi:hypothetical protein
MDACLRLMLQESTLRYSLQYLKDGSTLLDFLDSSSTEAGVLNRADQVISKNYFLQVERSLKIISRELSIR